MLDVNSPPLNRQYTGQTDPGLVRSVNQDSFYLDPEARFFIVADGMGGHAGGQEASAIAAKLIAAHLEAYWDSETPSPQLLQEALIAANKGILEDQTEHPERRDMGTTAVIISFRGDGVWRAHVGDSRLYRLRGQTLEQITEDHTWVSRALKMGDIEPEQARIHPWRHVLFQCLGRQDLNYIDVEPLEAEPGDIFLMCSDGLTEEVSDDIIQEVLMSDLSCEEKALNLITEAKEAGGSDNITIVLVQQS
ncbi:MAG: SpoIIE family protein phosphatase [Cyanobacteria bacterium RI_101]|nr:SpoIIE family protein phosphatase [Cyanobacteria bacterium RI_101]